MKSSNSCSISCDLCKQFCSLSEGEVGKCGVQTNHNGEIQTINKGKIFNVSIKRISDFLSYFDGTTITPDDKAVILSGFGCSLRCQFCDFWDTALFPIIKAREVGREKTNQLLIDSGYLLNSQWLVEYCKSNSISAVVYGNSEPIVMLGTYLESIITCKKAGLLNIFETNGEISDSSIDKIVNYVDFFIVKLKSFDQKFYTKICKGRLNDVLDTIRRLHLLGIRFEIRYPLIPDENDSVSEIERMSVFLASIDNSIPVVFTKFRPDYRMLDKQITSVGSFEKAVETAKGCGLINATYSIA